MGLLGDWWETPLAVTGGTERAPEVQRDGLCVKPEMVRAGAMT